jgi:hypothetical protein
VTVNPRPASALRNVWLDLGWLVVLVVSLGFPFVVDAWGKLTYAWSLAFWGIPILYLIPLFLTLTAGGHGRRRRALLLTVGLIVGLGVVLDFLLGPLTLTFPGCVVDDGRYLYCLAGRVPIEEILFYALGPIAIILVYAAADERWLKAYNPKDDLLNVKLLQISPPLVVTAVVAAVGLAIVWRVRGEFPTYATFLTAGALLPAMVLYRCIGRFINWPAFAATSLYVTLTSVIWEVTLAVPRGWWGYEMRGMLAAIAAWSRPEPFPVEAAFVWLAAPFSSVLTYEFAKAFMHHPSRSSRVALIGPP